MLDVDICVAKAGSRSRQLACPVGKLHLYHDRFGVTQVLAIESRFSIGLVANHDLHGSVPVQVANELSLLSGKILKIPRLNSVAASRDLNPRIDLTPFTRYLGRAI